MRVGAVQYEKDSNAPENPFSNNAVIIELKGGWGGGGNDGS